MRVRRRTYLATLALLGAVAGWGMVNSPSVVGQEAPECLGAAATIVGERDATPDDGVITGTDGPDVIVGTEEADTIDAGAGDDRVCGLAGDDTITGGDGFDRVNGGPGEDSCDTERQLNCESGGGSGPDPAPAPSTTTSTTG